MNLLEQNFLRPSNFQIALFFSPDTIFKPIHLANEISLVFEDIFIGDPIIIPTDSPREIPKVVFKTDGIGEFAIGYERADLILNWQEDCGLDFIIETSSRMSQILIDKFSLSVIRVGLIINFITTEEFGLHETKVNYIQRQKLQEIEELNLSWFKKIKINERLLNRWIRFSQSLKAGTVSIDTNTLPKEDAFFTEKDVETLISEWTNNIWSDINAILEW